MPVLKSCSVGGIIRASRWKECKHFEDSRFLSLVVHLWVDSICNKFQRRRGPLLAFRVRSFLLFVLRLVAFPDWVAYIRIDEPLSQFVFQECSDSEGSRDSLMTMGLAEMASVNLPTCAYSWRYIYGMLLHTAQLKRQLKS